jgi:hypothetical protein
MTNASVKPLRRQRANEAYEIGCLCGARFETPAVEADRSGLITCTMCRRVSRVEWCEASTGGIGNGFMKEAIA